MTSERVLSVEVTENNAGSFPIGVRILVVESDPTCLRIVSKMLQAFGYEVTTATRATDALHILREKEDEINLILTETHLPDMDQHEILETLGELSSLPVVVFSADNNESAMIGCLYKGAALYLMKPIIKNDVKNLWQLTYRTKIKTAVSGKGSNSFHGGSSEEKASSVTVGNPSSTMGMTDQKGKRKELEEMDNDDEDNNNLTVPKKRKLVWTNELHNRFLQAIRILGIDGAHPKKILQHMNVPGLKKENVSSHLQKYRLYLKREQDAMLKTMIRDCHPSSTFNLQGGFSQYTNSQFFMTASQSEYGNNFQNNLCSPMSVHSLGSVHSPSHVKSNYNGILIPNYGQVASQSKQLYPSYPNSNHTEIRTPTDGNFSRFGQKGNHSVEDHLNQGTTLSNIGTHGPTFLGNSQQQVQFPLLQPQPLPEKEDESDILDIATVEELELLVMEKEFLEDPNNDLWL
ncbi:two-component response regulator ARR14-like isoform X1 [Populus nigra]|uniref:two-component response regulator ARR14-like isoform X1 n=2 Tax=Populus nigra TaxID=3691 RepID=UPI002B2710E8|nr:two-component response regulator ARR14-like isoform X1 [Populus nigra]